MTGASTMPNRLRSEASRALNEHGNTDFFALLNQAADEIQRLEKLVDSECRRAEDAHVFRNGKPSTS